LFDVVHIFLKIDQMFGYMYLFQIYLENKIFTQMDYSYTRIKDQLFSDTIPVSDRDSNARTIRQRRLTRPRVGINIMNDYILNLTLMTDERGDEGEDIDADKAESKGLNCRCALVIEVDFQQKSIGRSARCSCYRSAHIQKFHCIRFSSK